MENWKILDCTLRDGGYYTSWDFSNNILSSYFSSMKSSQVDVIELGYISPLKKGIFGQYFYLNEEVISTFKNQLRKNHKIDVMVNYKDVDKKILRNILSPVCKEIDIVRFAIPPEELKNAVPLLELTKELGCEVGVNVMYLSKYANEPTILDPIKSFDSTIDYLSLVDSYGACMPEQVGKSIKYAKDNFNCQIGFHGHDNLHMAFANAISAISQGADWIDSTLLGMGRGAGNLKTELILPYHAKSNNQEVNYASLESILVKLEEIKEDCKWGTNLSYILSGYFSLPQADVMNWIGKRRYTPESIVTALGSKGYSENNLDESDFSTLSNLNGNNTEACIIIGGGSSVSCHAEAISKFAMKSNANIIHSSLKNVFSLSNQLDKKGLFISLVGQELKGKYSHSINDYIEKANGFIATKPPRFKNSIPTSIPKDLLFQTNIYSSEDKHLGPVMDITPLAQCLGTALELDAKDIFLVGFDGYTNATVNEQELTIEIKDLLKLFMKEYPEVTISSLTPNGYSLPVTSVYSLCNEL